MPRILIFNGTPQTAESRLVEAGSRTYDTLIREAIGCHFADRTKIDYVTLRVADGEHLPGAVFYALFSQLLAAFASYQRDDWRRPWRLNLPRHH